ncbi:DUF1638 domain-containing protein [Methanolobus sp. ZRKC3]|uniref:DUF1638 domain-containing protein n=1 Tax=Methanolobus sp. ZRKC3 TaxID=3125786 RepID=UPI0032431C17
MTVLSIIGCKMLQDEMIWLIENDSQIDDIIVLETGEHLEFIDKLDEQGISYELKPEISQPDLFRDPENEDKFTLIVDLVELGLHMYPKNLKSFIHEEIEKTSSFSDGILLFYGLCGNALEKVEEQFESLDNGCKVRILRDDERVVDDCIGATVGGWAKYLKLLKDNSKEPAMFFTPMFARYWDQIDNISEYSKDPEEKIRVHKMLLDMAGYSRVAKVNTGLTYTKDFDKNIEEYAKIFGFDIFEIEGGQEIFEKCYNSIKSELFSSS